MKNKKLILYGSLLITSCLSNVYGMHELVRKQIDDIQQAFNKNRDVFLYIDRSGGESDMQNLRIWRSDEIAKVVLNSGELMTDTEKLNHLVGDSFFLQRKEIIKNMIDEKKISPNTIVYQGKNPQYEAVLFKDTEFLKYLLEKGAKSDNETIKMMNKNS